MEEKISQVFIDLAKENNLSNLTEITLKEYAKAHAATITSDEGITDEFKATHKAILTTMNGQLYKQNKDFDTANKADYERQLEEYKKNNPQQKKTEKNTKEEPNAELVALQEQVASMKKKEEEREQAAANVALIKSIKDEFKNEDKTLKSKFDNFVDNSNKIVFTEDAKTNFARVKESFEAHERIDLDSGRVRMSAGLPTGFDKTKYDRYFKKESK